MRRYRAHRVDVQATGDGYFGPLAAVEPRCVGANPRVEADTDYPRAEHPDIRAAEDFDGLDANSPGSGLREHPRSPVRALQPKELTVEGKRPHVAARRCPDEVQEIGANELPSDSRGQGNTRPLRAVPMFDQRPHSKRKNDLAKSPGIRRPDRADTLHEHIAGA